MHSFRPLFDQYTCSGILSEILGKTSDDVVLALNKPKRDLEDFKALISPAAKPYIEEMAQQSYAITRRRYGHTMQMYAPMYLSNMCQNVCTYCGFSKTNKIKRKVLTPSEILEEASFLKKRGFDHILLVTGEAQQRVGVSYLKRSIELLKPLFSNISIEVQPMSEDDYRTLIDAGLYAVLVYQETYDKVCYKKHHLEGEKADFYFRLDTPDRLGRAGIHKIGIGALLGLDNWRSDTFMTALHLHYLHKTYWKTKFSISFPRLRPHTGGVPPKTEMSDADLLQIICAFRLFNEDVELSLSTREQEDFRDNVALLGVTTMSAESKTNPGGYVVDTETLEQFQISDERDTQSVAKMLQNKGLEVVWKDWHGFNVNS